MLRSIRASLVAQRVKNLSAAWETWVQSLGCGYLLEEGMATHFDILAWRVPMDRGAWWATVLGSQRAWHNWVKKHTRSIKHYYYKRPLQHGKAEDHSLRGVWTLRLLFFSPCGCSEITNLGHLQRQCYFSLLCLTQTFGKITWNYFHDGVLIF